MNNRQIKAAVEAAIVIAVLYVLFWTLFWLFVIAIIAGILYGTYKLNEEFEWFETRYFYAPIISFCIALSVIAFGGSQILFNLGKIDKTMWDMAIETGNYVNFKYSKGHVKVEPNIEGIAEKIVSPSDSSGANIENMSQKATNDILNQMSKPQK